MAKYTITYKCGHTAEVQLYGKESERQSKINWYSTINCPECKAREEADKATEKGYPELTGTPKQVAWANQIRNKAVNLYEELCATAPEQNKSLLLSLKDQWIANETTAKYWIDNRDELTYKSELIKLVQKSTNFKKS